MHLPSYGSRPLVKATVAIDQYAEKALGNRDYFLNKPYGVGARPAFIQAQPEGEGKVSGRAFELKAGPQ
jgi:hypothetical protein